MASVRRVILTGNHFQSLQEQLDDYSQQRERSRRYGDVALGIPYVEVLAGRDGMAFILLPDPAHTAADIEAAANYLRANRDVVRLTYVRIDL